MFDYDDDDSYDIDTDPYMSGDYEYDDEILLDRADWEYDLWRESDTRNVEGMDGEGGWY